MGLNAYRSSPRDMSSVTIRCLCRRIDSQIELSTASLPADIALCHCELCRKTSGVLFTSYLALTKPPKFLSDLTEYRVSENASRYFCGRCGAHVAAQSACNSPLTFSVASGSVEHNGDVARVIQHLNISSTVDGGLSKYLKPAGKRHPSKSTDTDISSALRDPVGLKLLDNTAEKVLRASCHCGGVGFYVTRPNDKSTEASSPWPDLLVPYHTGSSRNVEDVKWWLRSSHTKYLAGACACASCRLGSGFPIQCWAFIPKANISSLNGQSFDFGLKPLHRFESSPGTFREFCGGCGATVFWHCNERPELIDVSVGLLSARSGSRAEEWLDWELGRVSFIEDAQDREMANALEGGLKGTLQDS